MTNPKLLGAWMAGLQIAKAIMYSRQVLIAYMFSSSSIFMFNNLLNKLMKSIEIHSIK